MMLFEDVQQTCAAIRLIPRSTTCGPGGDRPQLRVSCPALPCASAALINRQLGADCKTSRPLRRPRDSEPRPRVPAAPWPTPLRRAYSCARSARLTIGMAGLAVASLVQSGFDLGWVAKS